MKQKNIYTSYQKISADTLTPVQVYMKIRDEFNFPLLLESSEHQNKTNDYSYICFNPLSQISIHNGICYIDQKKSESPQGIEDIFYTYLHSFQTSSLDFSFTYNGFFGYTGYHTIPLHENISFKKNGEPIPELYYALYQYVLVFDHYHDELYIFSHHEEDNQSKENLNFIKSYIIYKTEQNYPFSSTSTEQAEITDEDYKTMVSKAKDHCQRGDVFQMVLSRKFSQSFHGDEFNVYRALRNINPSPYLFYFDYGNFRIFGSSPESQIIIQNNEVIIHPIAGTVKRSGHIENDVLAAEKLKKDPKENAEHVMLVDLARNDLSKHAGDVHVSFYKQLHYYSHVIHMVSEVKGKLKTGHQAFETLLDSFPAGTLSGAPKHKAMQLIHEYEPSGRSFYGGCIGMIDFRNQAHHAIMIRSFLSQKNTLHYQAGAGIVLSSNEESELQEVNNKINALRKAIQHANKSSNLETVNLRKNEKAISIR